MKMVLIKFVDSNVLSQFAWIPSEVACKWINNPPFMYDGRYVDEVVIVK